METISDSSKEPFKQKLSLIKQKVGGISWQEGLKDDSVYLSSIKVEFVVEMVKDKECWLARDLYVKYLKHKQLFIYIDCLIGRFNLVGALEVFVSKWLQEEHVKVREEVWGGSFVFSFKFLNLLLQVL